MGKTRHIETAMGTASQQQDASNRPASAAMKSPIRQLHEQAQLKIRGLHTRSEYHCYGFGERGKDYRYMLGFMTSHDLRQKVLPILNDPSWLPILLNKWLFHLHCKQFGIRAPQVYGVFEQGSGFTETGEPLTSREELLVLLQDKRPANLVIKPIGGIQGKQVLVLDEIHYQGDEIRVITNTGLEYSFSQLTDELDRLPTMRFSFAGGYQLELGGYLLQGKVQQHSVFDEIAPATTNTIRVVTFRDKNNDVHIQSTIARLGRRGSTTDNWDRGGLSVAIDPAIGMLGKGVLKPKYGGYWMARHPDTGVQFAGQVVPHWKEVMEICRHAARVTPTLRSIGWDIVVTAQGPVVIEGNPDWDLMMVQVHTSGLLRTAFREQLAQFGLTFPEESLPAPSIEAWWRRLKEARRERAFHRSRR